MKTARDLYSIKDQNLEKTMCRAVESMDKTVASQDSCCGNNSLYIKIDDNNSNLCSEEAGFPKILMKNDKEADSFKNERELLKKYHSNIKKTC